MSGVRDKDEQRVPAPPQVEDGALRDWLGLVADALNKIPRQSVFSYTTPESNVTASEPALGLNVASATSKFWLKHSGDTSTGWTSLLTQGDFTTLSNYSTDKVRRAYGGMYIDNTDPTIDYGASTETRIVPFDTAMPVDGVTVDLSNNSMGPTSAGTFYVSAFLTASIDQNSQQVDGVVWQDGSPTHIGFHRTIASAAGQGSASAGGILVCPAGSVLTLGLQRASGAGSAIVTIQQCQINMVRVD